MEDGGEGVDQPRRGVLAGVEGQRDPEPRGALGDGRRAYGAHVEPLRDERLGDRDRALVGPEDDRSSG